MSSAVGQLNITLFIWLNYANFLCDPATWFYDLLGNKKLLQKLFLCATDNPNFLIKSVCCFVPYPLCS